MAAAPTNKEGEDLAVPLPAEWDLAALRGLPITFYEMKVSPPCCKIRFMLRYYNVPYQSVNGKKPNSEYTKVPVLDIGDRQINDSYIIVKNLAPILQGRPLTYQEVELERICTFGLMMALEKATASSLCSLCRCAGIMGGGLGCGLRCLSCCVACCVGPRMFKDKNLQSIQEYGDLLRGHLGQANFFGGEQPNIMDVSIFGVLRPFDAARAAPMAALLGDPQDPLRLWHQRMAEAAKLIPAF